MCNTRVRTTTTTTTTTRRFTQEVGFVVLNSGVNPAVAMSGERDAAGGTSSARRRREQRLRSWAKHERLSVAMALAAVTHHSFPVGTAHDALWSQKIVTCAGRMRPQERIQRHTVEQIADSVPGFPLLFMVEPQMVVQLVDMLSPLGVPVVEQVIGVPKIVSLLRAARTVLCAPRTAEQVVEVPPVPTILLLYSGVWSRTLTFLPFSPRTGYNSFSCFS